ncbi:MAG: transcription elongation factor Spt4 [Thaumarchaeota archaeon]|nr:transcription elongation factor Spt4 [Candidatus Calditenuaceae archaeon]MDW8041494.1 transcription elongation factor subunit Spt4 [Nitrososphaerota archaeon]
MPKERACRVCKAITSEERCWNCGSSDLSTSYSGLVVMLVPEESELAKALGITKPGRYAVRVE